MCVQLLAGVLGAASLAVVRSANAIDINDDRKVRATGFDIIYEARELDLPQDVRDGLAQVCVVATTSWGSHHTKGYWRAAR